MKLNEVPQDKLTYYGGLKRVCYAIDGHGRYMLVESNGWSVEKVANDIAMDRRQKFIEDVKDQVINGELSNLAYFAAWRQMDARLLAASVGMMTWRVKRHLREQVFRRLSVSMLIKYANALEVNLAQLKYGPLDGD